MSMKDGVMIFIYQLQKSRWQFLSFYLLILWIPKIKGTRYRSSDELVNRLKDKFIGQIGMRIMQKTKIRYTIQR